MLKQLRLSLQNLLSVGIRNSKVSVEKAPILVAKTMLLDPMGRVLVLRRAPGDEDRAGGFDFPGGAMEEQDRDICDTAVRELLEETGIAVNKKDLKEVYTSTEYREGRAPLERHLSIANVVMGLVPVLREEEHDASWWFPSHILPEKFKGTNWYLGVIVAQKLNFLIPRPPV